MNQAKHQHNLARIIEGQAEKDETGDLCLEEQRAEHQSLPGDIDAENIATASISSRHTQNTRQPLAILRAVARYVDRPDKINSVQVLTDNIPGTAKTEGMSQAEQPSSEQAEPKPGQGDIPVPPKT